MEKANPEDRNREGIIRLPIGYRFCPTDQELLHYYLRRKVQSLPLPASAIPEFDVLQSTPSDLPGDPKENRYFFSKKNVTVNNCMSIYRAGCGYWKSICEEYKHIVAPGCDIAIGIKRSLAFCEGKIFSGRETQWIMDQLCLIGATDTPCSSQNVMKQMGDWIVCCVYRRKKSGK